MKGRGEGIAGGERSGLKFFFKEGENKKESRRLNVRREKCDWKRRKNRESKRKMIKMER